jgi:hypothetical protein
MGVATGGLYRSRVGFYETERGSGKTIGREGVEGALFPSFSPHPLQYFLGAGVGGGERGGGATEKTEIFVETLSAVPAQYPLQQVSALSSVLLK